MNKYKIVFNKENLEFQNKKFYYTEISKLFAASGIEISKYNWLIANFECNYYPDDEWEKNRSSYIWISGNEFSEILYLHQQIQVIWGTIVAYEPEKEFDEIIKEDAQLIKISKFDFKNVESQSKLGVFELVSIDSTAFSVVSKIEIYIENLKKNINILK